MNITITPDEHFNRGVAQQIAQQVLMKPDSVLCISTGTTATPIFDELVILKRELNLDFSKVFAFNVDEYVGVDSDDPASCYWRAKKEFYSPLGFSEDRFYIPNAKENDMDEGLERFQAVLDKLNGIDLLFLAVGGNGHIAFNEPGTPFDSGLYSAKLTKTTIDAKKDMFGGEDKVPEYGITMGIRSLMQAKKILVAARGAHKADIMKASLYGPITTEVPASVLQLHPFVDVIIDKSAAG